MKERESFEIMGGETGAVILNYSYLDICSCQGDLNAQCRNVKF